MYKNKKILGVITARSGSKGLKDKNIKELMNKPLIAYTIEAANKSGVFDRVIVSTDSEKYAQISKKWGADVPFLRSAENSTDTAGSWDVIKEVLDKLKSEYSEEYDIVILLQPTSPLRTANNIKEGVDLFIQKDADSVVGVTETDHPMFWCNTINEDLSIKDFIKKEYNINRQQLPKSYTVNGALYIVKRNILNDLKNLNIYGEKSYAYIMNRLNSIDIDGELDFLYVKTILENNLL